MGVMGGHFLDIIPERHEKFPWRLIPFIVIWVLFALVVLVLLHHFSTASVLTSPQVWLFVTLLIPQPRRPRPSEKTFKTVDRTGSVTDPEPLPCWYDRALEKYRRAQQEDKKIDIEKEIEPAELFMTVVVPAFNEENRLVGMLEEAVTYLENEYGTSATATATAEKTLDDGETTTRRRAVPKTTAATSANGDVASRSGRGWEILLIDDGSTDDTILTAQTFSRVHILPRHARRASGPWTHGDGAAVNIPPGSIRMVSLEENRGKGGAVTHGMRHARGQYVVFADADGASKFEDLGKLVKACQEIEDDEGRGVAVGSRAHLVDSEAVVKRSKLRNFLMHSFHLLLKFMTPPRTAQVKDTQCGFKLFSRSTLPYIVPHMHTEGWIFDVEMLMLAEFSAIPVVEVAIGWHEVVGSKLNVIKDSITMAWGLAVLRFCWGTGIYRR